MSAETEYLITKTSSGQERAYRIVDGKKTRITVDEATEALAARHAAKRTVAQKAYAADPELAAAAETAITTALVEADGADLTQDVDRADKARATREASKATDETRECRTCRDTLPIRKFPTTSKRDDAGLPLRADQCRACRDTRREA